MTDIGDIIRTAFNRVWSEDHEEAPPVLEEGTVLLETGMDSMAFAVLVAELDDELGYDPFSTSDEAIYPSTFGEFVSFYQQHPAPA